MTTVPMKLSHAAFLAIGMAVSLVLMMVLVTLNLQGLENQNLILNGQDIVLAGIKNDTALNRDEIEHVGDDQDQLIQNQKLMLDNQRLLIQLINQTKDAVSP